MSAPGRAVVGVLAVVGALVASIVAAPAAAQGVPFESARVLPQGQREIALFQASRAGVGHGVQLESRLLLLGLMPNLAAKWRWLERGPWHGALRLQLTYPGALLRAVAREGAGGLLPPGTRPAETVMTELRAIQTYRIAERGDLNVGAGVEVAPRRRDAGDQPILDFPFLYPRFAALHRGAVLRVEASFAGVLPFGFGYGVDVTTFTLLGAGGGWSVELGGALRYQPAPHLILELGFRAARSGLPVGRRWHWLPWLDLRIPFGR